jgi:hypothetical protein
MKDFISRNYISILVGILIGMGLFRSNLPDFFGSSSEVPLQKGAFRVHNHSAIHALYYQGDFKPSELQIISMYMDKLSLFKNKQPAVLGLIKNNDSLNLLRMTTADLQKGIPEEFLYLYSLAAFSIKTNLYTDLKLNLLFTDEQWDPHQTVDETLMEEIIARNQGKVQPGTEKVPTRNPELIQRILERWMDGATSLSQARYYFPVQENNNWRVYYSDYVSEQVSSLAQVMFEAGFYQEGASNYIAFYTQADPAYFNGEASYVIAIPFAENQLNDGTASKTMQLVYNFLKEGYFRESKLLTVGTDYDFEPVLVRH